jgi:hypothetical protein
MEFRTRNKYVRVVQYKFYSKNSKVLVLEISLVKYKEGI